MASSSLSSSSGGRVISIRPESITSLDLATPDVRNEELEFDLEAEALASTSWESNAAFVSGPIPAFNRSSEALDVSSVYPDLSHLPTRSRSYEIGKRLFDIGLAIVIAPLMAVLIASIGVMIAVTSGRPVFFRQRRIGQHGREFFIWKFRTMRPRADRVLAEYLKRNAAAREEWNHTHKLRNDPRITRLGKLLRKTSLDELPQILNVFAGDMSFVGPRPIVRAESFKYAERYPYYLAAVPGVTGLWQVSGRCDVTYEARTILDETYVCKWSMMRDIWILLKTPRVVIYRNGAY